jgi:hypothetical protein
VVHVARVSGSSAGLIIDTISPNLDRLPAFINRILFSVMRFEEGRAEAYARLNAPWTDRTTNARNGLTAKGGLAGPGLGVLVLAHRVPYGIWLEVRFGGKYAIIMPTLIDEIGPHAMETVQGILDRFPNAGV